MLRKLVLVTRKNHFYYTYDPTFPDKVAAITPMSAMEGMEGQAFKFHGDESLGMKLPVRCLWFENLLGMVTFSLDQ